MRWAHTCDDLHLIVLLRIYCCNFETGTELFTLSAHFIFITIFQEQFLFRNPMTVVLKSDGFASVRVVRLLQVRQVWMWPGLGTINLNHFLQASPSKQKGIYRCAYKRAQSILYFYWHPVPICGRSGRSECFGKIRKYQMIVFKLRLG